MDKAHITTDKQLATMERKLKAIYSKANKDVGKKLKEYLATQEERGNALLEAVKGAKSPEERKKAEEAYNSFLLNKTLHSEHFKALSEQYANELLRVNETAADYINGRMPDVYSLNYNETGKGIAGEVKGYSFEMVDASTVKSLAKKDETLLPYKTVNGKKDVRWNTKQVNSEIMQGILQGESIPDISKRLTHVTEMNLTSAVRNARTATTSAENRGRMDSYHRAQDMGVKIVKVWMATNDERTREEHLELDGQEREIDEPFENSIGKIMYPGDPDADPANVYNCRCTLITKVLGFERKEEDAEDRETEPETAEVFIQATSVKEAEEYISQYVDKSMFGATGVDYTGVGLDAANEVNRTLSNLMQTFDVPMFGGITAPAGNTKAGKMMSSATAAYSPIRKSYYLNRKAFKNVATANKAFQAEVSAINDVLLHPENYDFTRASSRLLKVIENSKISGRATIPTTIEQALQHEFGHSLERKVMSHELWGTALENMGSFAPTLSGYACQDTSEYIAESFCSFMQGEGKADPVLVKIFESFKR